jgi:hypothetical protein
MDLLAYLESMVKMRKMHKVSDKLMYCCIEEFVLKNGKPMKADKPFPDHLRKGVVKECFKNAAELALETGWTYCEGYALGTIIPVIHAWVIDDEGNVIDPTWEPNGIECREYYGVEIPTDFLLKTILRREKYGVIDNMEENYPLLTGKETIK